MCIGKNKREKFYHNFVLNPVLFIWNSQQQITRYEIELTSSIKLHNCSTDFVLLQLNNSG